ncbi:hypothetical protein BD770DRAFT_401755 [Pilaira anomala]|nr:hypothetical protein BD770DRAFT_401755 [Pilaira anomala]
MERLPRETFLEIVSFLDFETRFQFAYTCKNWHEIISEYNLYETVYIDKDDPQGPLFFFTKYKKLGKTVRSLEVNSKAKFKDIKQWPDYFPNLYNFSLTASEVDMFSSDFEDSDQDEEDEDEDEDEDDDEDALFFKTSDTFQAWKRLESLSEFTTCIYTASILMSGHYPNLTSIDLNFNIVPDEWSDSVMDHLLTGLMNTPCLKYFKLIVAKLTLKKLDVLHHNAPSIEALILEDCSLGHDDDDNLTTPSPALELIPVHRLKRLEMQGSRNSFYENEEISIPTWLHYIARNYPGIEVLKMNQFTPASIEYESDLVNILHHCNQLKTFNVDLCYLSANVLQAFDQTAIQLEKYSSQSQDLTELRHLSLSRQRHSIYRVDLVVPIGNTDLIEILSQFTGLTTINTYPSSDIDYALGKPLRVPINRFLKQHKKVEFLSLSSCELYMDLEEEETAAAAVVVESVLDTLEMEKVTIESQLVFDFIARTCLVLKVMILSARLLFNEEIEKKIVLNFNQHEFVYLKVFLEGYDRIELIEEKKTRWYKRLKEDGDNEKVKFIEQEEAIKSNHLFIQVKHVERIVFNLPRNPFKLFI